MAVKRTVLSRSPSAGVWVLACPPDINQHTLGSVCTHSLQRASLAALPVSRRFFFWPSLANETSRHWEKLARDRILEKIYWEEALFSLGGLIWVEVSGRKHRCLVSHSPSYFFFYVFKSQSWHLIRFICLFGHQNWPPGGILYRLTGSAFQKWWRQCDVYIYSAFTLPV